MSLEKLISQDLSVVHEALDLNNAKNIELFSTNPLHTGMHIVFDLGLIAAALTMVLLFEWIAVPIALLIIGNRQRALGNILHDCSHRNVSRNPRLNDVLAKILVAPLVFTDFDNYRKTHLMHHKHLGDKERDPEYMHGNSWKKTFLANLTSPAIWSRALVGDFAASIPVKRKIYIGIWWLAILIFIAEFLGSLNACILFGLWLSARATTFFIITLFREMCDHFGLESGGIFLFTRDIISTGPLRYLIHPRNDGYHLTHHLLPTVPYHYLPQAHKELSRTLVFQQRACICSSYFFGTQAVIRK